MWFDSHCHLFACGEGEGLERIIERARAAGVEEMLVAGTDLPTSKEAARLAARDGIYAAAGVHPNDSRSWDGATAAALEEIMASERIVAVGESGLDFYRTDSPPERQRDAFGSHIELAKRRRKALVIHTRDSVDDALLALEGAGPPERAVFHCWSGDRPQMERALALGAYISFAGNVTFKRSSALRALAALVPEDRLVIETDSPYLAPVPFRGKPNEPARVPLVGAVVAEARGVSLGEVAAITTTNARRLFAVAG